MTDRVPAATATAIVMDDDEPTLAKPAKLRSRNRTTLSEVLGGYDQYENLTSEYGGRGAFADYGRLIKETVLRSDRFT